MIDVIDYRAGNAPSVVYALEHLGLPCRLVGTPDAVAASERLVLPGVGAARATLASLEEQGLVEALAGRVSSTTACRSSASASGSRCCSTTARRATSPCLGWVPGTVRRFPDDRRVPQIGWNEVRFAREHPVTERAARARALLLRELVLLRADRSRRRARHHRLRRRVLLGRRARQHRRHAVPRREERRARASRSCAASREWDGVMLTKRLIACFDVIDGRVTKAQQFQDNIDVAPAEELAARLYDDQIDEIVFYDITASAEKRKIDLETVRARRAPRVRAVHRRRRHPLGRRHVRGAQGRRGEDQRRLDGGAQPRDPPRGRRGVRPPVHRAQHAGEARRRARRASRAATRCSSTARASPPASTPSTGCGAARTSAPARSS